MNGITTASRGFNNFLIILAAVGFAISLIIHVRALMGLRLPFEAISTILHFAVMIVFGLTIPSLKKLGENQDLRDIMVLLRGCPVWLRSALMALVGYTILATYLVAPQLPSGAGSDMGSPAVLRFSTGIYMIAYFGALAAAISWRTVGLDRKEILEKARHF